ncbi:hypothetical protein A2W12_00010 [Candidatus Nomurabacteria bacterium RBG_16_40_11]|nr:MAG: hypothetical protein A2W12_00010 [Candidatus Nomurabacteria bacterium RBG_16_40_11]OGI71905.1 MAG: hypothetical protein A2W56_02985 [Candidatus Nomurabacteria bacterium RIFCSPHIGHO2_02_41_18]
MARDYPVRASPNSPCFSTYLLIGSCVIFFVTQATALPLSYPGICLNLKRTFIIVAEIIKNDKKIYDCFGSCYNEKIMKRKKKKYLHVLWLPVVLFSAVVAMVFYYRFDPVLLTDLSFYMNLANPYMRIVRVPEGLRQEEVAKVVAENLDWDEEDKKNFINQENVEGHYFPKTYLIYKDDDPAKVRATMLEEFKKQESKIKKRQLIMNEDTVLKIASIIQREAAGKHDMNLISGIIWNRIFSKMKLQIDATLQYAKGNEEDGWWEEVTSKDRKIKSDYNTYLYPGLPPGPIASPGPAALAAAYNPAKTGCLFYMHDRNKKIHCAKTYEEHEKNIKLYLK